MEEKNKTVLLIEDEAALQEAVKLKMEKEGVKILTAETGEKGIEILKEKKPDLLWLDILLPGMNGLEVLRTIRADEKTRNLPVVVVSVSSSAEKIKQAFAMNVIDYIVKSEYTIDNIVRKIKEILNRLT